MPKVSVIIVAKNEEKYIDYCLKSVLSSQFKDIEILFIDDHSTDKTVSIVKNISQKSIDIPIRIFFLEDSYGLSAGRNLGMSKAQGEYISFVDADDMITPNMLLDYYYLAKAYKVPIVSGNLSLVDENYNQLKPSPVTKKTYFSYAQNSNHLLIQNPSCCTRLWQHDFIENETFLKGRKYEDIAFSYPLLIKAPHVLEVNSACYKYRETNGIMRTTYIPNAKILDILDVVKALKERCSHLDLNDSLKQSVEELAKMHLLIMGGMLAQWQVNEETKKQLMNIYHSLCNITVQDYCNIKSPVAIARAKEALKLYYLMKTEDKDELTLKREFQALIR